MNKLFGFFFLFILACGPKPQPIQFGNDECSFCKMTIVDRQHAAQIVTVKGKAYNYDAIECLLNDYKEWDHPEVALFLVSNYLTPGELVQAEQAYYLISEKIPSPMGGFLTAFASEQGRVIHLDEKAKDLDWDQLNSEYHVEN